MVSNIFKDQEFFNGLLLVCANGIGNELVIPDAWPKDKIWVNSKNAIVLDFRSLNLYDELSVIASVAITDENVINRITDVWLETPTKKLYIGDTIHTTKKVIEVGGTKTHLTIGVRRDKSDLCILVNVVGQGTYVEANLAILLKD